MEKYIILAVIIIGFLLSLIITRKNKDENNSLSQKRVMKLMGLFAMVFILVVIFVVSVS
ncbi:hypothetical protein P9D39_16365 [Heyndrickxia oleronia]|uniref:hypothetical protein n=1 Tax=Heyndrickxia oleronia TaxID=38875 RepID=UPI001472A958|nr:hypothetical protein [Heyndrickxia oleronia]MEC1375866.1 hypothetical protein [Heyndrickxia oleronia]QQZ05583.1 hypothetical protein I5818_03545 [Heyndrickxia oleronia]